MCGLISNLNVNKSINFLANIPNKVMNILLIKLQEYVNKNPQEIS